jgi:L-2,4-diaminobutyric acid acetyltransferase
MSIGSTAQMKVLQNNTDIIIGRPAARDGAELNRLVAASPPLDTNSVYCNLLQCTHFRDTAVCARSEGRMVGFVSGYLIPARPDTLFVWQVVVAESARGRGLAIRMLTDLLERGSCRQAQYVETTITPVNTASQALFRKLAGTLDAAINVMPGFDREQHFEGRHESEELWRIGPIPKTQTRQPK